MRNVALVLVALFAFMTIQGCYSGYAIKKDELAKLQSGVEERKVSLTSVDGEPLTVTEGTGLEVIDQDGLTYPLQPFNFKVTATQIVAPEQDLVLPLGFVDRVEVRKLNPMGTVLLITAGAASATAIVVGIVATAGEDTGF